MPTDDLISEVRQRFLGFRRLLRGTVGGLLGAAIGLSVAISNCESQEPSEPQPESEELTFFKNKVLPILKENCFRCHGGAAKIEGGLVLTERQGILDGGDSGAVVDLDDPESGTFMEAVRYERKEMPPDGRLSDDEIQTLQTWIEQGLIFDGNFTFKR